MKNFIAVGLVCLILGFIAGRMTTKQKEKISYVKGEVIKNTITKLVPYRVTIPAKPLLLYKIDTVKVEGEKITTTQIVDTSKIIADYIKKNSYKELLFDRDSIGKLSINLDVQYNKLQLLNYEFIPIQKRTVILKKRIITPFISSSLKSSGVFGFGAGIFYKNVGVGLQYIPNYTSKKLELEVYLKF